MQTRHESQVCFFSFIPYYTCTNDYLQLHRPRTSLLKDTTGTKGDTRARARDADASRAPGTFLFLSFLLYMH